MREDKDWLWIETLFKKIPLPYPLLCFIIGSIIYSIYILFSKMIDVLPLNFYAQLSAVSMSILIPFMLGGIQYLFDIMIRIISGIDKLSLKHEDNMYVNAKRRFVNSGWHYIFIISVVTPFYLIDWVPPLKESFLDHFKETYLPIYSISEFHTIWGLSFDIYIQLLGLFSLFLLSYILWIMFNITWTLKDWESSCCSIALEAGIFNTKMKIVSIKNSILRILFFYFSCISLAIISYLNPTKFFSKETGLLLVLLLIGISFFFLGLGAIQQALKSQVERELEEINKKSQEQVQKLKKITSIDNHSEKDEISTTSDILDVFRKQREELELVNTNVYDIRSVARFVGMLILPFISSIFKSAIYNSTITYALTREISSKINETIIMIFK